ncbi:MAG: ATPase [Deltaproteobacteria bacterium]|jgi:sugar (pentulose or hexulose) kinase|nr:ATPase [Deltaproteobacteria bacterium]
MEKRKYLGLELGSTRIKAVVIDRDRGIDQTAEFGWENKLWADLWTYDLGDARDGIRATLQKLDLSGLEAMGVSAMMHGYLAFDKDDKLLVPFRTWRNVNTALAAQELSKLFDFNVPLRWSVAHLYQAILDGERHAKDVAFMTTLAGYVHWRLTGEKCLGVGDASGMFPVAGGQWNPEHVKKFANLTGLEWPSIAPAIKMAGEPAGNLTPAGAEFLGLSEPYPAIRFCPPEGDAGTGMVATNSLSERGGNVSAGTSVFAMVVLEEPLRKAHPTVDVVTTPDGHDVAMVHFNECSTRIDGWINLFGEALALFGAEVPKDKLFGTLYEYALDPGQKPLAAFMRQRLTDAVSDLREGLMILTEEEGVRVDFLTGHGGYFKSGEAGRTVMSEALGIPIRLMAHSSEGGAWGMAVLASFMVAKTSRPDDGLTLVDFVGSLFQPSGSKP